MNKTELVSKVIGDLQDQGMKLAKGEVEKVVSGVFEAIRDEVKVGCKVGLAGFGVFSKSTRAARNGVNPSTKKPMHIPAKDVAKFKASNSFLD